MFEDKLHSFVIVIRFVTSLFQQPIPKAFYFIGKLVIQETLLKKTLPYNLNIPFNFS